MKLSPLKYGRGAVGHTLVQINEGAFEVYTKASEKKRVEYDLGLTMPSFGGIIFTTAIFKAVPISKETHPMEQFFRDKCILNKQFKRDLVHADLYCRFSKDSYSAALAHDEAVQRLLNGTAILLPFEERRVFYGPAGESA